MEKEKQSSEVYAFSFFFRYFPNVGVTTKRQGGDKTLLRKAIQRALIKQMGMKGENPRGVLPFPSWCPYLYFYIYLWPSGHCLQGYFSQDLAADYKIGFSMLMCPSSAESLQLFMVEIQFMVLHSPPLRFTPLTFTGKLHFARAHFLECNVKTLK